MITDQAKRVKAGAYAKHISDVVNHKHALELEIEHQRDELDLSGVTLGERVSTSPSMDAIPNGVARLLELIDRYETDLVEYSEELDTFSAAISTLKPLQQMALYQHYALLRQWPAIAKSLSYSVARMHQVHREALIALYPLMPEVWRTQAVPNAEIL